MSSQSIRSIALTREVRSPPLPDDEIGEPQGIASPRDVKRIEKTMVDLVNELNATGKRCDCSPYLNNFLKSWGARYLDCVEQSAALEERLEKLAPKLDDRWTFPRETSRWFGTYGHAWLTALSDNPKDPRLTLDPWYGEFLRKRKCGSEQVVEPSRCDDRR